MVNKNFVKEVRPNVEFSELSQKAFTKMKMKNFLKRLSAENLILLKGLKRPNTKSQSRWFFKVSTDV